ncbi:MAG TPA: TlpA disulfide reductase family protein [Solirubrobacteraceae bacterium]|nr:TlpA disulfide reductase family protein [Solirubrobacteraceae bacterium]
MRRRPGLRGWLVLLATTGVLVLLGLGLAANHPSRGLDQAIAQGRRALAPSVRLPSLTTGRTYTLRAFRGRVVVLNLWASWCEPCRAEAPLLERWSRRIAARGGSVVGIDTFDTSSDARSFIRQLHLTYPMLRDPSGVVKARFGVTGFPESFVVDRAGRVAAVARGPVTDAFMRTTVLPLLGNRT